MSKKALITGISGQDGAYLAHFLLDKGYTVVGLLSEGRSHSLERLKALGINEKLSFYSCILTDSQQVQKAIQQVRPDEIYNLAAISSVGRSFQSPGETICFNVSSVLSLLEAIRSSGLNVRFYQASSSEMFGNADHLPVNEKTPFRPVSPYAVSKVTGHFLTKHYREVFNLFCSCGILFNHESMLRSAQFVTKKVLSAAVRISKGSKEKLSLGNIDVCRDWGYAPAYVKAMWLMLQQTTADDYVIASGQAHSLREFIEIVFRSLGLNWEEFVKIDQNLYRPADINVIYGDTTKAKKELGWQYKDSFEDLVKRLVQDELYYQTHYLVSIL